MWASLFTRGTKEKEEHQKLIGCRVTTAAGSRNHLKNKEPGTIRPEFHGSKTDLWFHALTARKTCPENKDALAEQC